MCHFPQIFLSLIAVYGAAVIADSSCTFSTAIVVENLSASDAGPGGVSNSGVIALGAGLVKAGIQHLKRKRDDHGGGHGGKGGGGGGGGGNNGGNGDNLDCSSTGSGTETCYSIQSVPFCYSQATGSFHAVKISGNAQSGKYTLLTGETGNLYTGPYPTPTGTAASSRSVTSTDDHGGNGGNGNDDTRTRSPTSMESGTATAVVTAISTTLSGISTTSTGVFTTTLPATEADASTGIAGTVVIATASVSTTVGAGSAGRLSSSNCGFFGVLLGLFIL